MGLITTRECLGCSNTIIKKNRKYCSNRCAQREANHRYRQTHIEASLALRFRILARDEFKCVYCGRGPTKSDCILQIDHKVPRAKGGTNIIDNLVTACEECNLGKSDLLLEH